MFCKYRRVPILWLFFFLIFPAHAQEAEDVRVYSAGGSDFVLAAGGHRTVYRPDSLENGGFSLQDGDILQTGREGFVEIRFMARDIIIRIAENTSLSYHTGEKGMFLGLSYGRVLLSGSEGQMWGDPVSVWPGTAEVIYREGTVGLDYTIQSGDANARREPALRVYVLSGAADLVPRAGNRPADRELAGGTFFPVNGMEMVSLETMDSLSYIERKPLDPEIFSYWNQYRPEGSLPLSPDAPSAAIPAAEAPPRRSERIPAAETPPRRNERVLIIPPDYESLLRINKTKNIFLAGGISLTVIGAGLQGFARYGNWDNPGGNDILTYTGYGFLGLGVLAFGAALVINPKLPAADGAE
jgi:hypothetical protein